MPARAGSPCAPSPAECFRPWATTRPSRSAISPAKRSLRRTRRTQASLHHQDPGGFAGVTDDISDKDRREMERTMNQEVLETAKYPEIVFESTNVSASKVGEGQLPGEHGGQSVAARRDQSQPRFRRKLRSLGDMLARASASSPFCRATTASSRSSVAGGTLKLKDELKCSFDIVARKQGEL